MSKGTIGFTIRNAHVPLKEVCYNCGHLNPKACGVYKCNVRGSCPAMEPKEPGDDVWTPVASGKLPERGVPVLVTVVAKSGRGRKVRQLALATYWTRGPGHDDGEPGWCIQGDEYEVLKVIAWTDAIPVYLGEIK